MGKFFYNKNYFYKRRYLENLWQYRQKKVHIPFLAVWVGTVCTLQCKHCLHMIPFVENKRVDIDRLISDILIVLEYCDIDFLSVEGGEPFTHPDLYKLIEYVANEKRIANGKIVTNGTILPNKALVSALKSTQGKIEVRIDKYPEINSNEEKLYKILQDEGIRCHIQRYRADKKSNWKYCGGIEQKELPKKICQLIYSDCIVKHCTTLFDGELTACPRGIIAQEVFGIKKNKYEHVCVRSLNKAVQAKANIALCLDSHRYKDYCRYCLGLCDENPYWIKPGEQIERD